MKQERTAVLAHVHQVLGARINRPTLLLALCFLTAGLWLVFANFVVPPIIESVYRGESFSLLNSAIKGQAEFPVEHYLRKWNSTAMRILWFGLVGWMLALLTTSEVFFQKFVGEATPGTLGAIRMWTCAILLLTTLWEDMGSIAMLPLEYREEMGLMKILGALPVAFDSLLTSESGLRVFQRATELLLFLGAIGWRTRIVIPLCTLCVFVLNGILREYSGYWHQNLVPIYVLAVLSFTPCGDGWSIDRLRKIYQGRAVPDSRRTSAVYGWARYLCWVPIALTYAAAGFSKLRADGLDWVSANNMKSLLFQQTLYPTAGNFSISLYLAPAPDIVFVLLGIAAISGETLFVTVLFSRVARRILPAVTSLMHIGIIFLQNIVFLDLILLMLIFYNFTDSRKRIGRWLGGAEPIRVLYDGICPLCRRTIRILTSLDLFHRLEFQDFRRLNLVEFNHRHALNLTPGALEKEMFVTSGGKSYGGFEAYRVIASAVPVFWPLVPWLFLPGVSRVGKTVYKRVARKRLGLLKCDSSCSTETSQGDNQIPGSATSTRRHILGYSLAAATLPVVMGFFWFYKIEYYPFTAVTMFINQNRSVVTYYKTLGHRESGLVSPIYLEDTLGFMSINSRYEPLFILCFGKPNEIDICKKTLAVLGSAYNKKVPPGEKLTHLEIQTWKWNFRANPRDPNYGDLHARFVAEVPASGRAQRDVTAVAIKN